MHNRLEALLDYHQTPDQAGFRHNYSTTDHLFTTTIIHERAREWQQPLWVSAVDFKEAFDTIHHNKLWQALTHQNIPLPYIRLLQSLYREQSATVKTDTHSRRFYIQRGVKQCDPLSSLLFNAVLEDIFKTLKQRWSSHNYGVRLGHTRSTHITNPRFAGDVLLYTTTLPQLTTMLNDLQQAAGRCGLELHPDKTVILSNLSRRRGRQAATTTNVNNKPVKILNYAEATKYLGRKLTFDDPHTTEVDHRISTAWRKLSALRDELTNARYPLRQRLHLFNATVTPTALYGCDAWTTTKALSTKLQRTQRRMLRMIVGTTRRRTYDSTTSPDGATNTTSLEDWADYIKRATIIVESQIRNANIDTWPTTCLRRKWKWAAHIASQQRNRWSRLAVQWQPKLDHRRHNTRRQARPHKRWDDDLTNFIPTIQHDAGNQPTQHWLHLAENTNYWLQLENQFIAYTTCPTSTMERVQREGKDR